MMTKLSSSGQSPEDKKINQNKKTSPLRKKKVLLGVTSGILLSLGGSFAYGWYYLQQKLPSKVEAELSNFLNRPVKLGEMRYFALDRIGFGETEILPLEKDPATVSMKGLNIRYNLLLLLTKGKLKIDVTAIDANLFLQQGNKEEWLLTPFDTLDENYPVNLNSLQWKNANINLVFQGENHQLQTPIYLENANGQLFLKSHGSQLDFKLDSTINKGQLKIQGNANLPQQTANFSLQGSQLPITEINKALLIPLDISQGTVNANLTIKSAYNKLPHIQGIATLNQLTAYFPQVSQPLTNIQGHLLFRGETLYFDQVKGKLQQLQGIFTGSLHPERGLNLLVTTPSTSIDKITQALSLPQLSFPVKGEVKSLIKIQGNPSQPLINIEAIATKPLQIDQLNFNHIKANVGIENQHLKVNHLVAIPSIGGKIEGKGIIQLERVKKGINTTYQPSGYGFEVSLNNLPANSLLESYDQAFPVGIDLIEAVTTLKGNFQKPESLTLQGKGNFSVAKGQVNIDQFDYNSQQWQARVNASSLSLVSLRIPNLQTIKISQKDQLNGQFIVTGKSDQISLNNINLQGDSVVNLAGGRIEGNQINLSQGKWKGDFTFSQLNPQQLFTQVPHELQGKLQGIVTATGDINNFLPTLQAKGQGNLVLPEGSIQAQDFTLLGNKWTTNLNINNFLLAAINPPLPQLRKGKFSGQFQVGGQLDNLMTSLEGKGGGNIQLPQGKISVNSLAINRGNFITEITPHQLALSSFYPDLKGLLEGNLTLIGNIHHLDPKHIIAKGKVTFSEGIFLINSPLTATFNWQNQQLEILQATANNFDSQGWIKFNSVNNSLNNINSFNLQVNTSGIQLNQLPLLITAKINPKTYQGNLDFKGTITGTPETPKIDGKIALINLSLPDLTFEKALDGTIETHLQGIELNLAGIEDKIAIQLDQNYHPVTLTLQHENIAINGVKQDNQLYVETENLPLSLVNHWLAFQGNSFPATSPNLSGDVSGNITINLDNFAVFGKQITITNPQIDWLKADQLVGDFHYFNDNLSVKNSQLQVAKSRYDFNANLTLNSPQPTLEADIKINQGKIEDILQGLQFFEFSDFNRGINSPHYHKASDLHSNNNVVAEAGVNKGSLGEQLKKFNEVITEIEAQKQEKSQSSSLPSLSKLTGEIKGNLFIKTSEKTGLQANFNLLGHNWKWGEIDVNNLQIDGDWQNNLLILNSSKIETEGGLITLSGKFSDNYQLGNLQITNLPITPFTSLIGIPQSLNLKGLLNANLDLRGSRNNPTAQGMINLSQVSLNQKNLGQTNGNFIYQNARFNFKVNTLLNHQSESILIQGTLPYQFPLATFQPDNDQFAVQVNINNEGMALLNILTQEQLIWGGGKGDLNLTVGGHIDPKNQKIKQINAEGLINLKQAILESPLIPEKPLTNLNGIINLNTDQIQIQQLTGQFNGGDIRMTGSLPLTQPFTNHSPLTLEFSHLAFNLPDIYQGGIQGQLQVTGTALQPNIGGNIYLDQGEILLNENIIHKVTPNNTSCILPSLLESTGTERENITEKSVNYPVYSQKIRINQDIEPEKTQTPNCDFPRFNQLQLTLGNNIRIIKSPILNFTATGKLILNGTFNTPQPFGQIILTKGQVNLLASQLRLTGNNNIVYFSPENGLNPYLSLNFATAATETTRQQVRLDPLSSEINDPFTANRDTLQTVRIYAKVDGVASQLDDIITLSSEPKRSQREIITLLGGNIANLENSQNTTVGLANLAGSAVLGPVQGEIGSALGLSEFRIFPTQIINEKDRINSSQLGVAAEAKIDLTDDISFSILKLLNSEQPPQWGIRYRLNDNILLRGSSNFDDDNRGVIEYERRF